MTRKCGRIAYRNTIRNASCTVYVPTFSIRLPEEIERLLDEEAVRSARNRSDVVREAIAEYVARREREQFKGGEIGKRRPVMVLQDDHLLGSKLPTVAVLPLTTQYRPEFAPLRIAIAARDGLLKDCYVMTEHPRALNRSRFREGPLTMLTKAEISSLEKSLKAVLGLN